MTENETSPENLRKFLESDDHAMRRMGLSMAKGVGVPEKLYKNIFGLSLWDPEKDNRNSAKAIVEKIGVENIPEFPGWLEPFQWEEIDEQVRWDAIETLREFGDKRAMKPLTRAIFDDLLSEGDFIWEVLETLDAEDAKKILTKICEEEYPTNVELYSKKHLIAVERLSDIGDENDIKTVFEAFQSAVYAEYEYVDQWMDALDNLTNGKKEEDILIELMKDCEDHVTLCYLRGGYFEGEKDVAKEAIKEMGFDPEVDPWE